MGLQTDKVFIEAIQGDSALMQRIGGRVTGTAFRLPDKDADNVKVPYIIVTFDGLTNSSETKDEPYESDEDEVSIGIAVTASTLDDLHSLAQQVRETVLGYFREYETEVIDYQLRAEPIHYDSLKPCFWQILRYQCTTVIYET